ncbi:hypothetical protein [Sphingobacterium yanglingense]|uniref:Uncharacterized protein n=1 Tax=Sphingobacterium yanglingense TaxID=1437280 RepID=A0A4R6W4Z6_9SPHI|nr:hypothetical protein [Sphingobacterium yanglingense]TDQ73804.1 hypothetical protein CLV99_4241 [Sphingobacterium yanglingense]
MKQKKLETRKRELANWLQHRASKFSVRAQKWVFVISVSIIVIYCINLISGDYIINRLITFEKSNLRIDTEMIKARISYIEKHLDSISETQNGRFKVDSILLVNPGLLDSMARWKAELERLETP